MLKMIFSAFGTLILMVGILYLAYVCTRYIGKSTRFRGQTRNIKLIDQLAVGQDKSIAVIKTGGQYLLIGIASSQITVLRELDGEEILEYEVSVENEKKLPDFKEMIERLIRERDRKK